MEDAFKNAWHHVRGISSEEMRQAVIDAERIYGDIIDLPRPVSKTHPPLSMEQKAAQYSPFAALTGYGEAVEEVERLTDARCELEEDRKEELDLKMRQLTAHPEEHTRASFTYFVPDAEKEGGRYETVTGTVRRVDRIRNRIVLQTGEEIPLAEITGISLN